MIRFHVCTVLLTKSKNAVFVHNVDVSSGKLYDDCSLKFCVHYDKNAVPVCRQKRLQLLSQVQVSDDSCTLCFDEEATIVLRPCGHR